jgi:hypothetical protein
VGLAFATANSKPEIATEEKERDRKLETGSGEGKRRVG